jgi:hypothetical protein
MPIDHRVFWPPQKYSADDGWNGDHGDRPPYLLAGSYYVYFSRSDAGPSGGIYDLSSEQADLVVKRLQADRTVCFERLVGDMPGAGFAYQNEDIRYVRPHPGPTSEVT